MTEGLLLGKAGHSLTQLDHRQLDKNLYRKGLVTRVLGLWSLSKGSITVFKLFVLWFPSVINKPLLLKSSNCGNMVSALPFSWKALCPGSGWGGAGREATAWTEENFCRTARRSAPRQELDSGLEWPRPGWSGNNKAFPGGFQNTLERVDMRVWTCCR